MKKIIILISILCVFSGVAVVSAEDSFAFPVSMNGTGGVSVNPAAPIPALVGASDDTITLTMFYSHTCSECQNVLSGFLPQFLVEHPGVKVLYYDTADNSTNKALFASYNARYNRPGSSVPAIFVGDRELSGYEEIVSGLYEAVDEAEAQIGSENVQTEPDNGTPFPVIPNPAPDTFGTFTNVFLGAISFGQPSSVSDAFFTPLPDRTQAPTDDGTRLDSANHTPVNSLGFFDFAVPVASNLTPRTSPPEDTGTNAAFPIEFAFPDFTPSSSDNNQPSPTTAFLNIRLSDGTLLSQFSSPDTEVIFPPAMCPTCS